MSDAPNRQPMTDGLLSALIDRLGTDHVVTDTSDMVPYVQEQRRLYSGRALAVVLPACTDDVAFIVEQCREHGVNIVPQGGNTGLVGGGVPHDSVVVALGRMNRIRDIDPTNATLTVEAGCILQVVQDAARDAGRLFPLSLAAEGSCQIGGNLATNAGGINVLRYGNARDLVLGLEVVLADGRVMNGLTALRKNNTGYDMKQLFIGSEGTLGIITAAVLKLFPLPRGTATALVGCDSPHQILALYDQLRSQLSDTLTAFELLPHFAMDAVLTHVQGTRAPFDQDYASYALIELTTPDADLDLNARLESALADAFENDVIRDAVIATSSTQSQALWRLRESVAEAQIAEGASIKHDISVPVSRLADFIEKADAACRSILPECRICAFGHVGDGNLHYNVSQPCDMDADAFIDLTPRFNRAVHDLVADMNGSISAEHGIGISKRTELRRYQDPVALAMMERIKTALDPQGLFNPGKLL
ncbi:FAD-binding oxidoreductase [Aidingimonas halophila]|uniref:FAD/FMN-containing dehydrogenase n=1 Tax=Aidingimonas halophila TaxID=574349 RepID=A0A1H3CKF5_9GAMM|nr:FAD-binding oxidoreductase [Aidingimonas halophila]GHC35321.1 D-2-hydroxyacid dehydrogenase [Aidingimonas halophila]SDX54641.1 FAD/FMN-containing dehydrogenase [Aidingimonas halophila]